MQANPSSQPKNIRANHRGSTLSEFGPALFILVVLIFFPVLDLVGICFDIAVVNLLNYNQAHEAALLPADRANDPNGPVMKEIPEQWQRTGMARFVKVVGKPETKISYRDGSSDKTTESIVTVKTSVQCEPFFFIPIPLPVQGLNRPMILTATAERPMENPDNATP